MENNQLQGILLDCEQSNVLRARIIFFVFFKSLFVPFGLY